MQDGATITNVLQDRWEALVLLSQPGLEADPCIAWFDGAAAALLAPKGSALHGTDLVGTPITTLLSAAETNGADLSSAFAEGLPFRHQCIGLAPGDGPPPVYAASWVPTDDGPARHWFGGIGRAGGVGADPGDESDAIAAWRATEAMRQELIAALDVLEEPLAIFDAGGRLSMFNRRFGRMLPGMISPGIDMRQILEALAETGVVRGVRTSRERWVAERMRSYLRGDASYVQRFRNGATYKVFAHPIPGGGLITLGFDITPETTRRNKLENYTMELESALADAEERLRAIEATNRRIRHAAFHDELTSLPNRTYFRQVLESRLAEALSNKTLFGLLHLDLDRFREINESFGHEAGDSVLMRVAEVLQDKIDEDDFVARIGDDDFLIVTGVVSSSQDIVVRAECLIEALDKPMMVQGHECRFGASIGIAMGHHRLDGSGGLLRAADMALVRAKLSERRWSFYSDDLHASIVARKRLADDILRAIEAEEFTVFYQPQVDAEDLRVCGAEALVRWNHPSRGLLAPIHFLSLAEELHMLRDIDRQVMAQVARDREAWLARGFSVPPISINVSMARLSDPGLIDEIKLSGIPSSDLVIELLESSNIDDPENQVRWNIDGMKELGLAIDLDDFGTGHSSIVGLMQFEPSRLKIDKQFVFPILAHPEKRAVVRAIVDIARNLKVGVVAEGVETVEHAAVLHSLGCDVLQGHFISPAIPAEDFTAFLPETSASLSA